LWAADKLERQTACIRPDTVLVYTGIRVFDDKSVRCEVPAIHADFAKKILRYRNPITPSTVLARREILLQDGGFREDLRACEDWEMWVRLQLLGQFEAVEAPLTDYYVHPSSLSANPEKMLQALDLMIETTLLTDLHGFARWAWRRRIRAEQLCSAGLIARDNGLNHELGYFFQSLCSWPSPLWQPRRFAVLAASVRNKFRRRKESHERQAKNSPDSERSVVDYRRNRKADR
jgi:hypothetical protein